MNNKKFIMGVEKELQTSVNAINGGVDRRRFLRTSFYTLISFFLGRRHVPEVFAGGFIEPLYSKPSKIALIIDDIGYNKTIARKFVELDQVLTFSILPHLDYSRDLAVELNDQGYEVMLHQPMEPYDHCCDPGPGALFVGYDSQKIQTIMEMNIRSIPFAAGVNNHMGSKYTASDIEMKDTLKVIKTKGLFFVDSYTSSHSIAHKTARKYHMPTAHRDVFLDNVRDESAIISQLHRLEKQARIYGRAIGIGHPFPETAKAIGRFAKRLDSSGVLLVKVSKIL